MPTRSKIEQLPEDVRRELDKRLVANGFGNYEALAAWLVEKGLAIGKSSVHRYGSRLEEKLAAIKASTEAANIIAEAAPDDADLRSAASLSLIQTEIFNVLVALREAQDEKNPAQRLKILSRVGKTMAEISRASVNQKKWQQTVRVKAEAAVATVEKIAKKGGLSKAAVAEIREQILGIPKS